MKSFGSHVRWAAMGTALAAMATVASIPAIAESGAKDNPADWPKYFRTDNGWRYSPLDQVNKENVGKLKVAWIHQPGDIAMGLQATPIVVDGVVYYVGPNNNVFAVDGKTGKTIWHYKPELDPIVETVFYVSASRGVTVGHGMVYLGSLDGRFIALEAKSWSIIACVAPIICNIRASLWRIACRVTSGRPNVSRSRAQSSASS